MLDDIDDIPLARGDISLLCRGRASVFIVSPGIHISLGICVRGYAYHRYHGDITVTTGHLELEKANDVAASTAASR